MRKSRDMTSNSRDALLPDFARPPLVEVACGIAHEPVGALQAPHLGLLRDRLGGEYRDFESHPPLPPTRRPGESVALEIGPSVFLPRLWFLSVDGQWIVQVQRDRFVLNWRKHGDHPYPRFQQVWRRFEDHWGQWASFIQEEVGDRQPVPLQFELTYVNHVVVGDKLKSAGDIGEVVPAFGGVPRSIGHLGALGGFQSACEFSPPDFPGRLTFVAQTTTSQFHGGKSALALQLSAFSEVTEHDPASRAEWFGLAHKLIVNGFCDLTSPHYKSVVWGRQHA